MSTHRPVFRSILCTAGPFGQTNDSAVSADAGPYFNGAIVKLALP